MTLNILFLSITIKKRPVDREAVAREEMVEQLYQETKDRQISVHHLM
ncbi:YrzI family small protein [Bacillus sp. FJAT-29814]|nr:YrzI family small protein [Bacillus sp. FJAT-29814]